ncbi:MAG: ribonuclease III [Patescibacteria group bacterium]
MLKDLTELEANLGVIFKNKDLLHNALIHRSYLNEHPRFRLAHNERLEYLGDAVLELAVTENLYKNYPNPEGELTNWRASLVNAKTLATAADELGVDEFLYLSKGEAKDTSIKARHSILANTLEAIIGAIYLDQGFVVAKKFVTHIILVKLPEILKKHLYQDPKSKLQEIAQDKLAVTPSYKVLREYGPDHARHFVVGVFFGKEQAAIGEGSSKQEGQIAAAQAALDIKEW